MVLADETVTLDPVAVRVAVRVLLLPTVTLPKFKAVALEVSLPAEMPLPETAMVGEEFELFESTEIAPVALPLVFGVKRTAKVTLCPLLRVIGRVKPFTVNPAPVAVTWERVTVELPVLLRTSYCDRLLPTWTSPKVRFEGAGASEDADALATASTKNIDDNKKENRGRNMALFSRLLAP